MVSVYFSQANSYASSANSQSQTLGSCWCKSIVCVLLVPQFAVIGGWKLCLGWSRFTLDAEVRYALIEGEALAVTYALQQTRYYT